MSLKSIWRRGCEPQLMISHTMLDNVHHSSMTKGVSLRITYLHVHPLCLSRLKTSSQTIGASCGLPAEA